MTLGRRTVLAAGGAVAVGGLAVGCAQPSKPSPDTGPMIDMADAHTHLFNAADLPAGKFVEYVVVPGRWPGDGPAPPSIGAILDILTNVAKWFVVSARDERIRTLPAERPDVPREELARGVERRIRELEGGEKALGPSDDLTLLQSYDALNAALAAALGVPRASINKGLTGEPLTVRDKNALAAESRRLIAIAAPTSAEEASNRKSLPSPAAAPFAGAVLRLLDWAWLMMQSRQHHLAAYVRGFSPDGARPKLIVHHLVDFDVWLGDGPLKRSSHGDQIRFWHGVARARAHQIELKTFAGFCPLKYVVEKAEDRETTLDRLKAHLTNGEIAGVKVYPPMGFRAARNAQIKDDWTAAKHPPTFTNGEFASGRGDGLGMTAVNRWRRAAGDTPLAPALDEAMKTFLDWARAEDVPLMAHAGPGNQAGKWFGERANPKWWEVAIGEKRDVRLSLGHLVNNARPLVKAVFPDLPLEVGEAGEAGLWALDAPLRMMAPVGGAPSTVYGDLGYMPELIDNPYLAEHFFRALMATFGKADPSLSNILYGTDWIMLGMEARDTEFPGQILRAMQAADYPPETIDNIVWRNARRFLRLDA